jgi:hypothetical protein
MTEAFPWDTAPGYAAQQRFLTHD